MIKLQEISKQLVHAVRHHRYTNATKLLNQALYLSGLSKAAQEIGASDCRVLVLRKKIKPQHNIFITNHAIERTQAYMKMGGRSVSFDKKKMLEWLYSGKVVDYSDLLAMGYRPDEERADQSTYVKLQNNMIAVLQDSEDKNNLTWITTLSESRTPRWLIPMTQEEFMRLKPPKRRRRR